MIAFSASAWAVKPLLDNYYWYKWITALFITIAALLYVAHLSSAKAKTALRVYAVILCAYFFILTAAGTMLSPDFPFYFAAGIFPGLAAVNILLYIMYARYRVNLHLALAVITTVMIAGGAYDTLRTVYPLFPFEASTTSCMVFVVVAGYNIIERGYLNMQGWLEYARQMEEKELLVRTQNIVLRSANINSVIMLTQTIEAKDPYTRGHCLRVRAYCRKMGQLYGYSGDRLLFLEFGALLHDIGKIGVPGKVLNKQGPLDIEEFDQIKMHPAIGAGIVNTVEFYRPVVPIIRHHHEAVNGSGYPDSLCGDAICEEARMLAVADVYDALTTDRPYRKGMTHNQASAVMQQMMPERLDAGLVTLFFENKVFAAALNEADQVQFAF